MRPGSFRRLQLRRAARHIIFLEWGSPLVLFARRYGTQALSSELTASFFPSSEIWIQIALEWFAL